jgi:type IV pilus assembly protein PilB
MASQDTLSALVQNGLLSEADLKKVERDANAAGKPAEDLLYDRRLVDDEKLAELKSQILKIPYEKVNAAEVPQELLNLIPEETVRTYGVMPIAREGDMLIAGMLHPEDQKAQSALRFIAERNHLSLGVYLVSHGDWTQMMRRYSPFKNELEQAVKSLNLKQEKKVTALEDDLSSQGEDAPVIRIVAQTLKEAVEGQASDVHIEPQVDHVRVRFRVNGDLKEVGQMPLELTQPIISRIKVMSNLRIDETRIPQDGRFRVKLFNKDIDFRVATFPTPRGEKVAIRVLDPTTGLKSLEDLGVWGRNAEWAEEAIQKPFGLIVISGPTGSGKSTTLYALLQKLNKEEANIVSLEDPVEYFISGVNQSQVHPEIGYDFASGLREILRQDPDVIMVGEIRDNETAALAIQSSLTGHIVLSTLHTNNAAGVIPRLIDMKVEPFLLPSSMGLMMAQRLVSKVCDNCKEAREAEPLIQKAIAETLKTIPEDLKKDYKAPYQVWKGKGCEVCKGRGVTGRIAVFEIIRMTPEIDDIIQHGPTAQKILEKAKEQGTLTMREDGVLKALQGIVLIEDVLRETE